KSPPRRAPSSIDGCFSALRSTRCRPVAWFSTFRAAGRPLFLDCAGEKFVELGIDLFSLCDQLFHTGDLVVDLHTHHLLSGDVISLPWGRSREKSTNGRRRGERLSDV